jgi:uncharacterized membrane protein HdeD (DUF308 family)
MDVAMLVVVIVLGWLALSVGVALVIGRVVRRGDEDAWFLGSVAASAGSGVSTSRAAESGPTGAPTVDT